jgi:hypothetical protein
MNILLYCIEPFPKTGQQGLKKLPHTVLKGLDYFSIDITDGLTHLHAAV